MRRIGSTKMVRLAILATLLLSAASCRSISNGELVEGKAREFPDMAVSVYIYSEFNRDLREELLSIPWTFRKEVNLPIVGTVGGYYNPLIDHITLNHLLAGIRSNVVHELLHRIWFRNMWPSERIAFARNIDALLADGVRTDFEDFFLDLMNGMHPLNKLAWYTEAYSFIGEMVVNDEFRKMVPRHILDHYERFLVRARRWYIPDPPTPVPPVTIAEPITSTTPDQP